MAEYMSLRVAMVTRAMLSRPQLEKVARDTDLDLRARSAKEFELLFFLAQNPNKVFSRDDLLQNIWGSDVYVLARTVDVHIRKVREKIGDDYITTDRTVDVLIVSLRKKLGETAKRIETMRGVGYRFKETA